MSTIAMDRAQEKMSEVLEGLELDEVERVARLVVDHPNMRSRQVVEFTTAEELHLYVMQVGNEEHSANEIFEGGEAVFEFDSDGVAGDLLSDVGAWEFFEAVPDDEPPQIYRLGQSLLPGGRVLLFQHLATANNELVRYFAKHPERMQDELSGREFEKLLASIFRNLGYDVELTPRSGDGGLDLRLFHHDSVGTILTLVEAKNWKNPVGPDIVRCLRGVLDRERANRALIVTTSRFTQGAWEEARDIPHKMELADQIRLKAWLDAAVKNIRE